MSAKRRTDVKRMWQPAAAYDAAAPDYDSWFWQKVWHSVENDLVKTTVRSQHAEHLRVLDVGCGTGTLLEQIHDFGPGKIELVGIDISCGMLDLAHQKFKQRPIQLIHEDFLHSHFDAQSFDIVFMCRVASHIADLRCCFKKIASLIKKEGTFTFSDVYSRHAYECTNLPHLGGKIPVVTYKHRIPEIVKAAYDCSLIVTSFKGFSAKNLPLQLQSDPELPRTLAAQLEADKAVPFGCLMTFSLRT